MRIKQESVLEFIGQPSVRLIIPAYQREYSWQHDQCFELWLDINRAARANREHFTGTILYTPDTRDGDSERIDVIDGQQRVTTISLALVALCKHLNEHGGTVGGMDAQKIADKYLLTGDGKTKLLPSRGDAASLARVMGCNPDDTSEQTTEISSNIACNLAFFEERMAEDGFNPEFFWRGINLLTTIDAQVDNPNQAQLVFESLNSKGKPLTVADLVRNYLLLSESHAEQTRLYEEYWVPMQGLFAPDPGSLRLDSAIKGWLAVRFRKTRMRSPELVYSGFKQYVEDTYTGTKEDLLRELRGFCLVWAENYRFHAVKKFKSSYDWAINGAPTLTSNYPLKKANNEAYAQKVREELKRVNERW